MNLSSQSLLAVSGLLACLPAEAESLHCSGGITAESDSRISVAYKRGQPLLKDSYCAPVYCYNPGLQQLVPEATPNPAVPCQVAEDWLYERGPGKLMAPRALSFRRGAAHHLRP